MSKARKKPPPDARAYVNDEVGRYHCGCLAGRMHADDCPYQPLGCQGRKLVTLRGDVHTQYETCPGCVACRAPQRDDPSPFDHHEEILAMVAGLNRIGFAATALDVQVAFRGLRKVDGPGFRYNGGWPLDEVAGFLRQHSGRGGALVMRNVRTGGSEVTTYRLNAYRNEELEV